MLNGISSWILSLIEYLKKLTEFNIIYVRDKYNFKIKCVVLILH